MKNKLNEQHFEGSDFARLISILLHSRTQTHIFHWQTNSVGSNAEHAALKGYYDGIVDLTDKLVESYQGKYDIVSGYKSYEIVNRESVQSSIQFLNAVADKVNELRGGIEESYIQNQIDTIQELLYSTLYKLRNLQ